MAPTGVSGIQIKQAAGRRFLLMQLHLHQFDDLDATVNGPKYCVIARGVGEVGVSTRTQERLGTLKAPPMQSYHQRRVPLCARHLPDRRNACL